MNVVDDGEDTSNQSSHVVLSGSCESREKYKKSILHRYLADSVDAVNTLNDNNMHPRSTDSPHNQENLEDDSNADESEEVNGAQTNIAGNDNASQARKRKRTRSSSSKESRGKQQKNMSSISNLQKLLPRSTEITSSSNNSDVSTTNVPTCRRKRSTDNEPLQRCSKHIYIIDMYLMYYLHSS